jgi:hypothetical protein
MKVWCVGVRDPHEGWVLSWHPTEALARAQAGPDGMVTEYVIPDTKTGLLRWLNVHFTRDNG